jgi:DNA-binding MarR family transcriptional regulator
VSIRARPSPVSAWALVQIDPEHPISQKELAARLRCTASTVVDPTDGLEVGGLVIRQANHADRRFNVLVVTPEGKRVRRRAGQAPLRSSGSLPATASARTRPVFATSCWRPS